MSSPDKFWQALARAIDRPDLVERYPDRAARADAYEEISRDLATTFATRDADDWAARLQANDVPFAPALTVPEVIEDPQVGHLGSVNAIDHPSFGTIRGLNRPIRFDGENRSDFRTTPRLGEHTDEVLTELGIERERIDELRANGIV